MELSALESLKISHSFKMGKMVSPVFLGCFLSDPLILEGNENMY